MSTKPTENNTMLDNIYDSTTFCCNITRCTLRKPMETYKMLIKIFDSTMFCCIVAWHMSIKPTNHHQMLTKIYDSTMFCWSISQWMSIKPTQNNKRLDKIYDSTTFWDACVHGAWVTHLRQRASPHRRGPSGDWVGVRMLGGGPLYQVHGTPKM